MGIKRVVTYLISCDTVDCMEAYEWGGFRNKADAIRAIRDDGWGYNREADLIACPDHNDFDRG